MRYREARLLHDEDEVTVKKSGDTFPIVQTADNEKDKELWVMSPDGTWWRHDQIK